ncbi:phosphatidylinositol-binding protein scs2 [Coemansia sp. RSA 2559]|nr:phosphatidylinositol-binding protein scs2 [Coemansia sp. RSA 2559]
MPEDPPSDKGCRDKFLIQSIQISPEMESMPMTELWAMVEREAKSSISEKKLRVRHLPPVAEASDDTKPTSDEASKPAFASPETPSKKRSSPTARNLPGPSPLAKSVESQGEESVNEATSAKSASPQPQQSQPQQSQPQQSQPKATPASNRLFQDSSAAQSPEDTTTYANVLLPREAAATSAGDLDKANAAIKDLKQQLSECKAQLKKTPRSSSTTDGLSIGSVAIIALVAFLLGYFFF